MFCNYLLNCQILFNVYSTCSCVSILYIILSSPDCLSEHPCTYAFQHFCWLLYETARANSHSEFSFHISVLDLVTWLHLSKRVSAMSSLPSSQLPSSELGAKQDTGLGPLLKELGTLGPRGGQQWGHKPRLEELPSLVFLSIFIYIWVSSRSLPGLSILYTHPFVIWNYFNSYVIITCFNIC